MSSRFVERVPVLSAVIALLFLAGCFERSDSYSNLDAARTGEVFKKGWLPDLLPPSTKNMDIVTVVDTASANGKFNFACRDYSGFVEKLDGIKIPSSRIERQNEAIREHIADGLIPFGYLGGSTSWVFLCFRSEDECGCEFFVWR